jgi:hypothetical protein
MSDRRARATMWLRDERWIGLLASPTIEVEDDTREGCLARLRDAAGESATLTVEVLPALAGVAEAAQIMGWDKRRVITYIRRGSFPEPFATLASGRVWRREDVEAFALAWREQHARRRSRAGRGSS